MFFLFQLTIGAYHANSSRFRSNLKASQDFHCLLTPKNKKRQTIHSRNASIQTARHHLSTRSPYNLHLSNITSTLHNLSTEFQQPSILQQTRHAYGRKIMYYNSNYSYHGSIDTFILLAFFSIKLSNYLFWGGHFLGYFLFWDFCFILGICF